MNDSARGNKHKDAKKESDRESLTEKRTRSISSSAYGMCYNCICRRIESIEERIIGKAYFYKKAKESVIRSIEHDSSTLELDPTQY